ncbi:MAG: tRNA lysidine(34) synthetase TilS [Actinobacteria bacterium]|nr:tRNA lysidine(34) synthetase TilS [Actinomycetota bacterium]MSW76957.1 tRNA lysidine(34) synthetase TilS [Actinomycetota bacterium]MSX55140.1 tRNA lysidine(34) synthetase TilS [Actinomycetota bacterium]MSX94183.1 tRNA lysidine(34) synthetase TilS [Actinomycetota bacterium]MSZ82863.1 tRNA lysidine(34) synthetase TilS [Actinomycetota bacterium]
MGPSRTLTGYAGDHARGNLPLVAGCRPHDRRRRSRVRDHWWLPEEGCRPAVPRPPPAPRRRLIAGLATLAHSAERLRAELLARCTFPLSGTRVTCAVSGGADSTALLVLAISAGLEVTAVHVDHGLRPGSAEEALVVSNTATRFGAAFRSERVQLTDGPNLEARARAARFAVLPHEVLTGHTADDQAETILVNLLRGAGTRGMSAMRPGHRRPLLALRRAETEALCAAFELEVVHDPSNLDPRHLRNRVRHELLPLLADLSRRDPTPVLTRQADLVRDESDLLDELAAALDPTDANALAAAPVPLARRAVRRWLTADHPPDAATVERVLAVARGEAVAAEVGGGRRVARRHRQLTLFAPTNTPQNK